MSHKSEYRVSKNSLLVIDKYGQVLSATSTAGATYYVSRNITASGDGRSWGTAFKTIGEAVSAVNADFTAALQPSKGRNTRIFIGEGYYTESAIDLTANDCTIIVTASGHHDSTVLYVTSTTAPAFTISGSNNTIFGLGGVCISTGLQPVFQLADGAISNSLIKCAAVKDVVDSCSYGIEDLGNAYTQIIDFEATVSCKTAGIRLYSATNNGIQQQIINPICYGTPAGILIDAAAHEALIKGGIFLDDTSDTPDVVDTPILNNGGTNIVVQDCYSQKSTADLVTGAGTSLQANNFQYTAE